jgi:predicted patatin/cPLA2 family phospholipase
VTGSPDPPSPLRLLAERVRGGARADGARIALGVEGGGLAVSMAAGMALALERAGLTRALDVVYGTSSGSLVAAYAAAGRMADAIEILDATCTRAFVDWRRLGRAPVVSLDHLMGLVRQRPPLGPAGPGMPLRVLVVGVHDGALRTLGPFSDADALLAGVRASMAIPFWSGPPVQVAGEQVADGGLIESIPVATPLREGATHVLALRSRDADYRKGARGPLRALAEDRVVNRLPGRVPELVRARPACYDAEAEALQRAARGAGPWAGRVQQLAPVIGTPLVGRLQIDRARVRAAVAAGREVVERALEAI